jgi:hypothetical protein
MANPDFNPKALSRRDFLKLSGAASWALVLSACAMALTPIAAAPAPTNTPLPRAASAATVTSKSATENSPFGIFGPYVTINEDKPTGISKTDVDNYLKDVGARWVEEMPRGSDLDEISTTGVNLYSRIGISNQQTRDAVKKYKDKVKYWEAGTEPDGVGGWKDNPTGYVAFLKDTYTIVKEECADCYLVPGGLDNLGTGFTENSSSAKFLKAVLQAGGGKYFDAFEFKQHAYTASDYPELKNKMDVYGRIFADYGIDIKKMPVFLETAHYDGNPSFMKAQSEAEQASGLLKTWVYGLAQGIDKIFWNLVVERHNFGIDHNSAFNYYGLVNNPDNDGLSHKKLAYYTYKKMVEILEGSDWNNIQTIQEAGNVYIYKFTKSGRPIYVAWWDYFNDATYTSGKTKQISLTGLQSNTALVTEAVPKFSSGAEVTDYNAAFRKDTLSVISGTVTVLLGENPVFIEENRLGRILYLPLILQSK